MVLNNLQKLQENFADHIYDKKNIKIFDVINSKGIAQKDRLQIYRNNVLGVFEDALTMTYEITKKIVGNDYFQYLVKKYCEKYYSNSGNLEDFGEYFPDLIKNIEEKHKLPYLSDIAKLEWLHNLSYFTKDVKDIDIKKLQALGEEDFMKLSFNLHPSCFLIESKYPICLIWETNNNDTDIEINLEKEKGEFILIERSNFKVNIHKLEILEYKFLNMIQKGKNIYQIYEELSKIDKNFDIGFFINKFVSSKIITNFCTSQ